MIVRSNLKSWASPYYSRCRYRYPSTTSRFRVVVCCNSYFSFQSFWRCRYLNLCENQVRTCPLKFPVIAGAGAVVLMCVMIRYHIPWSCQTFINGWVSPWHSHVYYVVNCLPPFPVKIRSFFFRTVWRGELGVLLVFGETSASGCKIVHPSIFSSSRSHQYTLSRVSISSSSITDRGDSQQGQPYMDRSSCDHNSKVSTFVGEMSITRRIQTRISAQRYALSSWPYQLGIGPRTSD